MTINTKRLAGAALGCALVLLGAWLAGVEWERGAAAFFVYIFVLWAAAAGAMFPYRE